MRGFLTGGDSGALLGGFLKCSGVGGRSGLRFRSFRTDSAASGLVAFGAVLPRVLAVQPRELEELLAQGLVFLPPPVTALLGFFGSQRLGGEPGVVGVLRPDLHVDVAEDAAVVTRCG